MVTSPLKISDGLGEGRSRGKKEEDEGDTLISVAPALTLMAASIGLLPAAGICFKWIRLFFFSFSAPREEKKNQYLGALHDRSIISELKWLSGIVIW